MSQNLSKIKDVVTNQFYFQGEQILFFLQGDISI